MPIQPPKHEERHPDPNSQKSFSGADYMRNFYQNDPRKIKKAIAEFEANINELDDKMHKIDMERQFLCKQVTYLPADMEPLKSLIEKRTSCAEQIDAAMPELRLLRKVEDQQDAERHQRWKARLSRVSEILWLPKHDQEGNSGKSDDSLARSPWSPGT